MTKPRVLIVEDEAPLVTLLRYNLEKEGFEVVRSPQKHFVAGSSAEVISELERFHALGVTHFMFRFLDPESLERFVQTVVPHFAWRQGESKR